VTCRAGRRSWSQGRAERRGRPPTSRLRADRSWQYPLTAASSHSSRIPRTSAAHRRRPAPGAISVSTCEVCDLTKRPSSTGKDAAGRGSSAVGASLSSGPSTMTSRRPMGHGRPERSFATTGVQDPEKGHADGHHLLLRDRPHGRNRGPERRGHGLDLDPAPAAPNPARRRGSDEAGLSASLVRANPSASQWAAKAPSSPPPTRA
jgi:hypothetical protein